MVTLFRPGTSLIHQAATGPKLLAMIGLVTLISIMGKEPIAAIVAFISVLALYLVAFPAKKLSSLGPLIAIKQVWSLKYLLVIIVIPQLILGAAWPAVATNALRLIDAILLATLFTLTTKNSAMITTIERACSPLKRIGIKPETVSLTIAMAINSIPVLMKFMTQTKEAQQARGVKPTATLIAVPLLVASLKYADDFAEALTARGVEV